MPAGAALGRDDQRHLAGRLVDHLVAEHHRAAPAAGSEVCSRTRRGSARRGRSRPGRRVDLVGRVDLAGVQHPLAVEAERGRPRRPPGGTRRRRGSAGTARRSPAGRASGRPSGCASGCSGRRRRVVAGRLLADDQRPHVDRGHEVGRAEDDRLDARRRRGDRVDVDQARGVLDLRLDADPADLEPDRLLDLGQQQVERSPPARRSAPSAASRSRGRRRRPRRPRSRRGRSTGWSSR